MKKIALVAAALFFSAAAFAVEGELSFTNKVSSDIVEISDGSADFAGFTEKAVVTFDSEQLDFGITAKASDILKTKVDSETTPGTTKTTVDLPLYGIDGTDTEPGSFSWYIEFRPWQWLTFGWSDDVYTYGSYIPVEDDNVKGGNIAAENGFAVILRPIGGLRIGTAIDFSNLYTKTETGSVSTEEKVNPVWNFGIDYTYGELFSIGVAARDILGKKGDDWNGSVGAYFAFTGLEGANFSLGYTFQDKKGIADVAAGQKSNLINFGASYGVGAFNIDFDTVFGDSTDPEAYDLYIGACPSFDINDNWSVDVTFTFKTDINEDAPNSKTASDIFICPEVTYGFNRHTFALGFGMDFAGNSATFTIPVSWKYKFTK